MTGGFLMAVIAAAVTIVIATPEYAEPVPGSAPLAVEASPSTSPSPDYAIAEGPTSKPPEKLKGYRWPVRGGMIIDYYDWDKNGFLTIDGRRIHEGLSISWFRGALVKAAHKGKVVAAGRDWAREVGFEDPMDGVIKRLSKKKGPGRMPLGVVIDDGNGYRSVITGLKELQVKVGDKVKAGQPVGKMAENCCVRYELVRMDGEWMRVAQPFVKRDGYPRYVRERVDPLLVFHLEANKAPNMVKRRPPADPPRVDSSG